MLHQLAALLAAAVLEDANLTFVVRTAKHKVLLVLTSVQKVVYLVRHAAMHSGILNSVAKIESTGQVVVVEPRNRCAVDMVREH